MNLWSQVLINNKEHNILDRVAECLPFHEVCRLRQVCSQFDKHLTNDEEFDKHLTNDEETKAFKHFVLSCNSLYLNNFHGEIIRDLCNYARKSLESFRVETVDWFQKSYALITVPLFNAICETFSNLRILSLPMCSGIGYDPDHLARSTYSCIINLRRLPHLHTLDLSGCNITDHMMSMIAQCKSLTELNLSVNKFITDAGIKSLLLNEQYPNSFLKQMKALDLSYTSVSDEMFRYTIRPEVGAFHNLKQLHIMNTKITHVGLERFFANQHLFLTGNGDSEQTIECVLERINLFNCSMSSLSFLSGYEQVVRSVDTIPKNRKKKGNNNNNKSTSSDVSQIKKWDLSKSLQGLCIHWNPNLQMDKELGTIGALMSLKELVICDLKKWTSQNMQEISNLSQLETLSLRCERIDRTVHKQETSSNPTTLVLHTLITSFPNLKKIDLHASQEDFVQQQYIRHISQIPHLEYIHLQSDRSVNSEKIGSKYALDEELGYLVKERDVAKRIKHLSLVIPNYAVREKGFIYLNQLTNLEELNMRLSNSIHSNNNMNESREMNLLPQSLKILHLDQYCEDPVDQLSPGTLAMLLKSLTNLQKLVIANQHYHTDGEMDQRYTENFIPVLVNTCTKLLDLRIDLNCFRCTGRNLDPSLQMLKKLSQLQMLGLTGAEGQWSKNMTILPLSKSLKQLIHLYLPQQMIDQVSATTFQRLFPNTIVFGPNGPVESTINIV